MKGNRGRFGDRRFGPLLEEELIYFLVELEIAFQVHHVLFFGREVVEGMIGLFDRRGEFVPAQADVLPGIGDRFAQVTVDVVDLLFYQLHFFMVARIARKQFSPLLLIALQVLDHLGKQRVLE